MKPLFGSSGLRALRTLVAERCLLAFDFDGTLAPLAPRPDAVVLDPVVRRLLVRLRSRTPVVIITGRRRDDALRFFGSRPPVIIGNHGAEGVAGKRELRGARAACAAWRDFLDPLLAETNGKAWLEDKAYSLTVHSHSPLVLRTLVGTIKGRHSLPRLRLVPGKASLNLLPAGLPDKGDALRVVMKRTRCTRALYVGDDVTDEDAFFGGGARIIGVHVGNKRGSRAAFSLSSQEEVPAFMRLLLSLFTTSPLRGEGRRKYQRSSGRSREGRNHAVSSPRSR
jgi:trehalose 6-phosphate phosphatase